MRTLVAVVVARQLLDAVHQEEKRCQLWDPRALPDLAAVHMLPDRRMSVQHSHT